MKRVNQRIVGKPIFTFGDPSDSCKRIVFKLPRELWQLILSNLSLIELFGVSNVSLLRFERILFEFSF